VLQKICEYEPTVVRRVTIDTQGELLACKITESHRQNRRTSSN